MHRHILCGIFHTICCVNDAKASVMATRRSALVWQWRSATLPWLLSGVVKCRPQQWQHHDQSTGPDSTRRHFLCVERDSKTATQPASSRELSFDLCSVCLHPNTRYQTPLNRITVHCHTWLSSHVKACRVIRCRHNTVISPVYGNC
jgi:hypothetical protein